jgi:hypothetical protein
MTSSMSRWSCLVRCGGTRVAAALLTGLLFVAGCGDGDSKANRADAGSADDAAGGPDCYENPTTHLEIINACTDAEKVVRDPVLPLLEPDGTLPPLP